MIRRRCGQEGDELIQADVTKEMAFKEGGEVGNVGPKKLILIQCSLIAPDCNQVWTSGGGGEGGSVVGRRTSPN